MGATRTQVYLTEEQRTLIDRRRAETGVTLAQVVRAALDAYLADDELDAQHQALDATFGSCPGFGAGVPSRAEWDHRG